MIVGPLLPPSAFAPVVDRLARSSHVLLVHARGPDGVPFGNAGDRMIELAAEQLLTAAGIAYVVGRPGQARELGCDTIVLFGGGSFGHPYCRPEAGVRRAALDTGLPCVVLPVTAYGTEWGWQNQTVFLRDDRGSRWWHPAGILAQDLALGLSLDIGEIDRRSRGHGRYHSICSEGMWAGHPNDGDPRSTIVDPLAYARFAAEHESIETDIVHLAIAALMCGVGTTLLPTRLHKQRSIWSTSLRTLGCRWADAPLEGLPVSQADEFRVAPRSMGEAREVDVPVRPSDRASVP